MDKNAKSKGWFASNWKWAVPVGCVGLITVFVAFIAAIVLVVFGAIRSSDAYQVALARAQGDPSVAEALGEPIEPGWFVSGNINVDGASGHAELAIPVNGSRAAGTLYVVADKVAGEWVYETMELAVDGGSERVSLLMEDELADHE